VNGTPNVILVPYHLGSKRVSGWRDGAYAVPEAYVDAVRRAGGQVSLILPGDDRTPSELLARTEALLLVGGGDVEPWRYEQRPHELLSGVEPDRDAFEISLLREASRLGTPTLCVCRGMQIMNVAFGGTLLQHLPDDPRLVPHGGPGGSDRVVHDVSTARGSRVAEVPGGVPLSCSSHHHQGVDRLGPGLVATGWSTDGLVEAIEHTGSEWFLGVQWHPEDTAAEDPAQQALFDGLVDRARSRA
jgi:putative glutamine amidotransferase